MAMNTYLDFAENDFHYFMDSYNRGVVANAMAADAQEICEKYMKHILNEYYDPKTQQEDVAYNQIMRTHNLIKILRFMEDNMDFYFKPETKSELRQINGYYFTARYPGDESIEINKEDLDLCSKAAQHCRQEILQGIAIEEERKDKDNEHELNEIFGVKLKNTEYKPDWEPRKATEDQVKDRSITSRDDDSYDLEP